MARNGQAAAARRLCEPAVAALVPMGDRFATSEARMCLAEILLAGGDPAGAGDESSKVIESAVGTQNRETEWRAWALRAHALQRRDGEAARQAAQKARQTLERLQWDPKNLDSYSARPDIQVLQRTIQEASR